MTEKHMQGGGFSRRTVLKGLAGAAAGVSLVQGRAFAQDAFPNKPITILVPWTAGGGTSTISDVVSKISAQENFSPVPMVLDHRPGASGLIGTALVANKKGDPYVFMPGGGALLLQTVLGESPIHPLKDLTPLALSTLDSSMILVPKNSKYTSLKQVVDELKAAPNSIALAESGTTGWDSVATNMFSAAAGISFNRIPFGSGADVHTALLGGQVPIGCQGMSNASPLLQAGELRALAIYDAERNPVYPDVPTIRESGYDVSTNLPRGWFGPAGLKPEEIEWYGELFKKVDATPAFAEFISKAGGEKKYLGPADFTAFIQKTMTDVEAAYRKLGLIKA